MNLYISYMNFLNVVFHGLLLFFILGMVRRALSNIDANTEKIKSVSALISKVDRLREIVSEKDVARAQTLIREFHENPSLTIRNELMNTIGTWYHRTSDDAMNTYAYLGRIQDEIDEWTLSNLESIYIPRSFDSSDTSSMFV